MRFPTLARATGLVSLTLYPGLIHSPHRRPHIHPPLSSNPDHTLPRPCPGTLPRLISLGSFLGALPQPAQVFHSVSATFSPSRPTSDPSLPYKDPLQCFAQAALPFLPTHCAHCRSLDSDPCRLGRHPPAFMPPPKAPFLEKKNSFPVTSNPLPSSQFAWPLVLPSLLSFPGSYPSATPFSAGFLEQSL